MKVNVKNGKINRGIAKKILMDENTKLIELESYSDDYQLDAMRNRNSREIKNKEMIVNLLSYLDCDYQNGKIILWNMSSEYQIINEDLQINIVA